MLSQDVERYVTLQRILGYKFGDQSRSLKLFADYAGAHGDEFVRVERLGPWRDQRRWSSGDRPGAHLASCAHDAVNFIGIVDVGQGSPGQRSGGSLAPWGNGRSSGTAHTTYAGCRRAEAPQNCAIGRTG
jgi:hypothetical protein